MEIRVYGLTEGGFDPRLITHMATDITYREHAHKSVSFTVKFPIGEYGACEFKHNRLLLIDKQFAGLIDDTDYYTDLTGSYLTVTGKGIKGLLEHRTIVPHTFSCIAGTMGYDAVVSDTETCIKHFWHNNFGENAEAKRRFPFIRIGTNYHRGRLDDRYSARFQKLSDVTAELAENGGLVVTAEADIERGAVTLDVRTPTDRTYNNGGSPIMLFIGEQPVLTSSDGNAMRISVGRTNVSPVVISLDRKTARSMRYFDGLGESGNAFYATRSGAQFADEALTMLYTRDGEDEPSSIFRREKHLNVSVSTPEAGNEYGEMRRQAERDMQNYEPQKSLTAEIDFLNLVRGRDYELGDIVTVQNREWGVETDLQITAVETKASGGGLTVTAALGSGKPGMIRRIYNEIKNS